MSNETDCYVCSHKLDSLHRETFMRYIDILLSC
ncbi:hypothetical protein H6G33_32520 [Calothrix sp. FACHB-1219]|nr:hypothetical protein [Calothrix sp. FACHB-168]MBD2221694.1 hypothetical protein [Calothrix sp. FACHB-1219]